MRTKMNIKTGDTVQVIAGKNKGKKGKVLAALPSKNRVIVENVNMASVHTKPNQAVPQGGIIHREAPIHASNVMLIDPKTKKPTRVGYKIDEKTNKKIRISKKSNEKID